MKQWAWIMRILHSNDSIKVAFLRTYMHIKSKCRYKSRYILIDMDKRSLNLIFMVFDTFVYARLLRYSELCAIRIHVRICRKFSLQFCMTILCLSLGVMFLARSLINVRTIWTIYGPVKCSCFIDNNLLYKI